MAVSQSQKSKVELNHDYISNLPAEVKERILVKLPIKEAVRTSILSSTWDDSWVSIPDLVFEESCSNRKLIKLVDKVLSKHRGPIRKFKLVSDRVCTTTVARWLITLSENGIKDLELLCNDDDDDVIVVPYHLIVSLERLSLARCVLLVSAYFKGLKLIRTLILSDYELSVISIENLISGCPLLEHLELSDFSHYGCLRILAPKLTFLKVHGEFHDIVLETPKVTSVCIHLICPSTNYHESNIARDDKESNFVCALGRLSSIQKLDIGGEFLDYLARGPIPGNLPAVFDHLTNISLRFNIYPNEITAALCLFQNAPNLEILSMKFAVAEDIRPPTEAAWETKATKDGLFSRLKVVNIMYGKCHDNQWFIQRTKWMLRSAKFVLSTAPVLEKLNCIKLNNLMEIFEMLKWFPKLSKMAEIVFLPKNGAR